MPHTHITLRVQVSLLNASLNALVDQGRIPINVSIGKLIDFFGENLPQEVQQPFRQQSVAFLEQLCEVGDEARLMREYLGDLIMGSSYFDDLPKALSTLTHKELPKKVDYGRLSRWIGEVASALDEPYITKLVIGTLLSGKYVPHASDDINRKQRRYFLSLLK